MENFACRILWDFSIIADRLICHNRPDIVVVDKLCNKGYFIDFIVLGDTHIRTKTIIEKLNKHHDLHRLLSLNPVQQGLIVQKTSDDGCSALIADLALCGIWQPQCDALFDMSSGYLCSIVSLLCSTGCFAVS